MKKVLAMTIFALFVAITGSVNAASSDTVYWKGDSDLPIWVERDDGSKMVFRISSARMLDMNFKSSFRYREFIVFDVYEMESNGSVEEHPVGSNGGYGMFYNPSTEEYMVVYRESRRFPKGQELTIDNPYQRKICAMLVHESHQHGKLST